MVVRSIKLVLGVGLLMGLLAGPFAMADPEGELSPDPVNKYLAHLRAQPYTSQVNPFFTDKCTFSPQWWIPFIRVEGWSHCCVEHDIAHWAGGEQADRIRADRRLKTCIQNVGGPGKLYHSVVKRWGAPHMVFDGPLNKTRSSPWGYGWDYYVGHDRLDTDQKKSVCEKLNQWIETDQFRRFLKTYQRLQGQDPYLLDCF